MIQIFLIIGGGSSFYQFAKKNGLNPWVWALVPLLSYFAGAFSVGLLIANYYPNIFDGSFSLISLELFTGAICIGLAYLLMKKIAHNKLASQESDSSDILDHNLDLE